MALSQKQIEAIQKANKRFNIWCGAVRSGKTYSSILKLIDLLKNGPPGNCMIIGVNRDTVQRNVLLELYKFLGFNPPGTKSTETKLYGRNVYFVGAHDESAVRRIQGSTLAFAYVDEATCIPAPFWRMLLSRLSVPGAQLLATCNPEGPAHWLKKEYIDRENDLDLISWHFTLDDNPSLDEAYKEALKKEYQGMWFARYIEGKWSVAHGLVYDGFDQDNLYDHISCNPNYYVAGIDYGTTNATACVLCAISPHRWPQVSVVDEYYYDSAKAGRSKTDDELACDIYDFIKHKNVSAVYVDPAAASFKVELQRKDIPVIDAKNDVLDGIKVTSKFIANKNIVIHKSCRTLIEHIQSYAWDPKAADRGEDKPLKVNDHICVTGDTLIYGKYGTTPIKYLKQGDEIISFNTETKEFEVDEVLQVKKTRENAEIIRLVSGSNFLDCTPDHKIWTGSQWKEAKDFTISEIISTVFLHHEVYRKTFDKTFSWSIDLIERRKNQGVYCIGTKKNGTMIANGFITKNCDALRYAIYSAFPEGDFGSPDENISIEERKKRIYGDNGLLFQESNMLYM